jgi:hypothetical protein
MLINPQSIAMPTAVIVFFVASVIGACYGNSPFTCCKRSLVAMVITYTFIVIVIKIINSILVNAMISKQTDKIINEIKGKGNTDGDRS